MYIEHLMPQYLLVATTAQWLKLSAVCSNVGAGNRASDSCLMLDYVRVINFRIIIIIIFFTLGINDPEGFWKKIK